MDPNKMLPNVAETQSQKLTKWSKEPSVRQLKTDLEQAKPSHDSQMLLIQRWNDLIATKGTARVPKVKGRSSVQPKLIRRQAEWRYSALTEPFLGSNKLFKVSPVTFEDGPSAKQNELVLNWQFRTKINRVNFVDNFVRATVDEGTSITRVGWKRTTTPVKETVPVFEHYEIDNEEDLEPFKQALELKATNPRQYEDSMPPEIKAAVDYYGETQQATIAKKTGEQVITVDKVIENRPTVEVLNPHNFYIDPTCNGDTDKALFAIVSFETNKAELLKEPKRYRKSQLELVNWEGNTPMTNPDHETKTPTEFSFQDTIRKKVVAYEYWGFYDIHGDGVLVPIVATWIGDVIIRMEENPFPDQKIPFVLVPYLPTKRGIYGEPDAELLEDNQAILGAVTRGMIDLMGRSANGQQGTPKGFLDPLNKRRFDNGQDYEYNPNLPANQALIEHKYPEIPQSAIAMVQMQNQEGEALTGVKSFGGGLSGESYGDVAAGIRGALDAASKREMAILRRLARGMTQIGNKFIAMNGAFMSEQEVIRVTNTEFVTVTREELEGQFDLDTDISTAEVDNSKSQDLAFMLQTIGPKGDQDMTMMILAEIADLKRMPELAEKIRRFKPQPTPEQVELQKLEIELKRAEVEKVRSEIALNGAKAQEAMANKDQKDLDYVEQESGTKHAREIDKQKGQAMGNQNLAVTKALVTPHKKDTTKPDIEAAVGFNSITDDATQPTQDMSYDPGLTQPQPLIPALN